MLKILAEYMPWKPKLSKTLRFSLKQYRTNCDSDPEQEAIKQV